MAQSVRESDPVVPAPDTRHPGLAQVKAIVAFASAKGGTGKSTMVANIAVTLALKGRKVGVADYDFDAPSIGTMLGMPRLRLIAAQGGLEPANGPLGIRLAANDPDISRLPVSAFIDEAAVEPNGSIQPSVEQSRSVDALVSDVQFGALDLLLIDLAPGFEHALALCKLVERTALVLVTTGSGMAVRAARRALEEARRSGIRMLGLIENMQGFYCGNCHSVRPLLPQSDLAALTRDFDLPILGHVPFDSRLAESCDIGRPFVREYPQAPVTKVLADAAASLLALAAAPAAAPRAQPYEQPSEEN